MADELHDAWVTQGLDHVTKVEYDVLLSYPNYTDLSFIELLDDQGTNNFTTQLVEKVIEFADNNSDIVPPFNSYSATGDAQVGGHSPGTQRYLTICMMCARPNPNPVYSFGEMKRERDLYGAKWSND